MDVTKTVILAAGVGSRMQRSDESVQLSAAQSAAANAGLKSMIPIDRPFLDYVLSGLADAGVTDVCLVIGPQHAELRRYYEQLSSARVSVAFAIQPQPLGTANALAAAAPFAGDDDVIVLNSDNYYPRSALTGVRTARGTATIGFDRDALIADGDIAADRITGFAVLVADEGGNLRQIVEKPSSELLDRLPRPVLVSMNCWRFDARIFTACRAIDRSTRGEYEIPDAVMHSMKHLGCRYQVVPCHDPVLDLSRQSDIPTVTRRLRDVEVNL